MRTGVGSVTFPDMGRIRGHNVINSEKKTVDFRNILISFFFLGNSTPYFYKLTMPI